MQDFVNAIATRYRRSLSDKAFSISNFILGTIINHARR